MGNIYVNGQLMVSRNYPQVSIDNCSGRNSLLRFGHWWAGDSNWLKGDIDDVRIYGTPLNQSQINTLFEN